MAPPALRVAGDEQHGVVAGHRTDDLGQRRVVDRRGEELRGAGRRAQHDDVRRVLDADDELLGQPAQPRARHPRREWCAACESPPSPRQRVDEVSVVAAQLDGAELVEVARERRLRDDEARRRRAGRPAPTASARRCGSARRRCGGAARPSCWGRPSRRLRREAASSAAGSAARNRSASSAVSTSGGASRIAFGATSLTMKPASSSAAGDGRRDAARSSDDREQQPLAPDAGDERVVEREHAVAQPRADRADVARAGRRAR